MNLIPATRNRSEVWLPASPTASDTCARWLAVGPSRDISQWATTRRSRLPVRLGRGDRLQGGRAEPHVDDRGDPRGVERGRSRRRRCARCCSAVVIRSRCAQAICSAAVSSRNPVARPSASRAMRPPAGSGCRVGDPQRLQGHRVHPRRVVVVRVEQDGTVRDDRVEHRGGGLTARDGVEQPALAEHPVLPGVGVRVLADELLDLLERPRADEVDALERLAGAHEVEVGVDDPRDHQVALEVDLLDSAGCSRVNRRARGGLDLLVTPGDEEASVVHRERRRPRPVGVGGEHLGIAIDRGVCDQSRGHVAASCRTCASSGGLPPAARRGPGGRAGGFA